MTQTHDELYDSLKAFRQRNALIRHVRDQLKGNRLDIRELVNALVISYPKHPEKGRIYIPYVSAEVSLKRPAWEYLGYLEGYSNKNHDPELCVDAGKIIRTLTGQDGGQL